MCNKRHTMYIDCKTPLAFKPADVLLLPPHRVVRILCHLLVTQALNVAWTFL